MTNLIWVLAVSPPHSQSEWWYHRGCVTRHVTVCGVLSLAHQWFGCPVGRSYPAPDGCCSLRAWWHHVSPCFLSCHALYNPQEEDSVPPRPPLPQSYEPNPPTVPPLPSHAGVRTSSLHRPEDRKANHRNGTHSVSSLTSWLTPPSAVSSHVIARCGGFQLKFFGHLLSPGLCLWNILCLPDAILISFNFSLFFSLMTLLLHICFSLFSWTAMSLFLSWSEVTLFVFCRVLSVVSI